MNLAVQNKMIKKVCIIISVITIFAAILYISFHYVGLCHYTGFKYTILESPSWRGRILGFIMQLIPGIYFPVMCVAVALPLIFSYSDSSATYISFAVLYAAMCFVQITYGMFYGFDYLGNLLEAANAVLCFVCAIIILAARNAKARTVSAFLLLIPGNLINIINLFYFLFFYHDYTITKVYISLGLLLYLLTNTLIGVNTLACKTTENTLKRPIEDAKNHLAYIVFICVFSTIFLLIKFNVFLTM